MLVTSTCTKVSGAVPLVLLMAASRVEGSPHAAVYEITSGTFSEVGGGWISPFDFDLPDEYQHFIELTTDGALAEMRILGGQLERWREYDPIFPTGDLPFDNGEVLADTVRFTERQETAYGTGNLDYTVTLDGDLLMLEGSFLVDEFGCFDCPTSFYHTDVRATLVPEPPVLALLLWGMLALCVRRRTLA